MPFATKAAKDKAIATTEANIARLKDQVAKHTSRKEQAELDLKVAEATLEERKAATVVADL